VGHQVFIEIIVKVIAESKAIVKLSLSISQNISYQVSKSTTILHAFIQMIILDIEYPVCFS